MAVAERLDDRIIIAAEFREKELVKTVPGAKWDTDAQTWWVPLSWAACHQIRGVFCDDLVIGAQLGAWFRHELQTRVQPCLDLREADDAEGLASVLTALHPYQRAGVQFLVTARQGLLADEMGLGKTVQAIAALEVLGDHAYPALIVCPNSMKFTWEAEFKRWAPGREPIVITGSADKKRKAIAALVAGEANVGIINYEALRSHTRLEGYGSVTLSETDKKPKELNQVTHDQLNTETGELVTMPGFASVIADEAHRAKDPRTQQTRALWYVGRSAEYRYALTGTPIANSPEDIWTLMRFVSPSEFPAKTKFIERYAMQSWNVFGFMQVIGIKGETSEELYKIIDPRFIRRLKANVLPQLPPKIYTSRYCDMVPKQKKAYEEMRKEQYAQLESGILLATNPLTKLQRLLQFASAFGELGEPSFEVRHDGKTLATYPSQDLAEQHAVALFDQHQVEGVTVRDATPLLLTEPSCKIDALEDIVAEIGDQRAVVFAESRQLIELAAVRMQKIGYKVGMVTGTVAPHDRQVNVDAFNRGETKLLLATLGAGGTGLSFVGCSIEIFLQRSFDRVLNLQAEARCDGIGRGIEGQATQVIDIITTASAEARVHESGAFKAEMAEQVTRDAETLKKWLAK